MNIPNNSMFISSDDIFNNIINIRNYNNEILEKRDNILNTRRPRFDKPTREFDSDLFRESIMQNYELFIKFMNFRNMSRAKLIQKYAGTLEKMMSNGEMSISYFDKKFNVDSLFLLDEPENSMSQKFQFELIKIIEEATYRCDCQFIIATHSPFIFSLSGAKIYNLDLDYVIPQKWYELENVRFYYDFFKKYKSLFEDKS